MLALTQLAPSRVTAFASTHAYRASCGPDGKENHHEFDGSNATDRANPGGTPP